MGKERFISGFARILLYIRIALGVATRYAFRPRAFGWSPIGYVRFLAQALRLLLKFRHHKSVRTFKGTKIDLYLPAYPTTAFYYALEGKLLRKPPRPVTVVYSMTKACPYKCVHCYQRMDENAELDETQMIQTARDLQEIGVAMFDIEGGEPFVRFQRLLNLFRGLDDRSELWVNSTGMGLKPGMLEQLKENGLFGLMISIHSPDPEIHDGFTGVKGSHQTACDTVRRCRELGLVAAVNSVLSEEEIRQGGLESLMTLAKDLDADFVQLIHPKPAGKWLGRTEEMQRGEDVILKIQEEHLRYNSSSSEGYPSLAAQAYEEAEWNFGCTAGAVDRFYVNATGEVQPCEFLNLSFGNVREEPLPVIMQRMRDAFGEPGTDWLCCTQSGAIYEIIQKNDLKTTPVPWSLTKDLVSRWDRGKPTPLYRKLGIYK